MNEEYDHLKFIEDQINDSKLRVQHCISLETYKQNCSSDNLSALTFIHAHLNKALTKFNELLSGREVRITVRQPFEEMNASDSTEQKNGEQENVTESDQMNPESLRKIDVSMQDNVRGMFLENCSQESQIKKSIFSLFFSTI